MATQGPALNEKPRYCWLNSDKMDGRSENVMAIKMAARIKHGGEKQRTARQPKQQKWRLELKMAERSEERHGNPSSKNGGETETAK